MMKKIAAFAAAGALALSMTACAEVQSATDYLSSPTTTQAATNVGKIVTAVACGIGSLSNSAQGVATAKNASGQQIGSSEAVNILSTIYVASEAACVSIGGIVQGLAQVSASAVTPVTGATSP